MPVVALPNENSLDTPLPRLPKPGSELEAGSVDEKSGEGSLGLGADIPPIGISSFASFGAVKRLEM